METSSKHVEWARKIKAVAQVGLEYAEDPYDRQRYRELRELAAEMMAGVSDVPVQTWRAHFEQETGYATPKVDVRAQFSGEGKSCYAARPTTASGACPADGRT